MFYLKWLIANSAYALVGSDGYVLSVDNRRFFIDRKDAIDYLKLYGLTIDSKHNNQLTAIAE